MCRSSSARCAPALTVWSATRASAVALARIVRKGCDGCIRCSVVHKLFLKLFLVSFTLIMSGSNKQAIERVAAQLDARHTRRDEPLAPYTTFRIGGPADLFFEATSADALANAVLAARQNDVPYFVLGLGANVLMGDRGFRGLVIRNTAQSHEFREQGDVCHLWTESGAVIKNLIQESVSRGWSGLEHHVGIPSTVGGAIWQNLHFLS